MPNSRGGGLTLADGATVLPVGGRHAWPDAASRPPVQCRAGESVLTRTASYAIRAMVCLAEVQGETRVTAAQVARRTGLPRNYLAKILRVLAHVGLLDSTRGPHGGYRLAQPADELSVANVLEPFERPREGGCMLSETDCPHRGQCRSRRRCLALTAAVVQYLRTTHVADLMWRRDTLSAGRPSRVPWPPDRHRSRGAG